MSQALQDADRERSSLAVRASIFATLATGVAFTGSILANVEWIAGPAYWRWHYHPQPTGLAWTAIAGLLVSLLLIQAWRLGVRETRRGIFGALALLAVAAALLRFSASVAYSGELSFGYVNYVVTNPVIGGYYTAAERVGDDANLLATFASKMRSLPMHAMNKPPGPTLLNLAFIRAFGHEGSGALVGIACGLLSLASIPLSYAVLRVLGGSGRAAYHAAALWAVVPGAVIFFPLFDPLLTAPTLALVVLWVLAMRSDGVGWSLAMGATLVLTLFFTFNILPIGLFIATVGWFAAAGSWRVRLNRLIKHASIVVAVTAAGFIVLWLTTGFDLIATLRAALANQAFLLSSIERPYPQTIFWDLIDYLFGVAWMPLTLAAFALARVRRPARLIDIAIIAGIVQLIITAITALLPGETARVWNFLIPLILIPTATELARWPRHWPLVVHCLIAVITLLMARAFVFMYAG